MSYSIQIEDGNCDHKFIAKIKGVMVGRLEIEEIDGVLWFWNVFVDPEFREKGIGTALIERAVRCHGHIYAAKHKSQQEGDSRHTSTEGTALINSCIRKGILSPDTWQDPDNPFIGD